MKINYFNDDFEERWGKNIFKKSYKSSINNFGELSKAINRRNQFYSSYDYTEDTDTSKLIVKAYNSIKDMITIMDFPFSVTINLKKEESGCFDDNPKDKSSRRIFISTNMFDSLENDEMKLSIFCGQGLHEASHLRYTYYRVYNDFIQYLDYKREHNKSSIELIEILINLLEDNRVEDLLLTERPGFQEFINSSRNYNSKILNKLFDSLSFFFEKEENKKLLVRYIKTIIGILRYPELIDKNILEKYSDTYDNIQKMIIPYPETLKDICNISKTIFNNFIKKNNIVTDSKELKEIISYITNELKNSGVINEIIYGVDIDSGFIRSDNHISKLLKSSNSITMKILEGKLERGVSDKAFFEKPNGDKKLYLNNLCKVKKYIPRLKKIITGTDKNYDFNILGCRSGLLDTNKLAEAFQGVPQVYIRQGHVRTNKSTICVLIDESGSMGGKREDLARQAAILLNETFGKSSGIDLYIYGHTADIGSVGYINLNIYKEGSYYNPKYSLSSSGARSQNRDGDAILEVANRIRRFTKDYCIMFVISDGCPCANGYGGIPAISDTAEKVKKAEKLNFKIIQISIAAVYKVEDMFDTYIDIGYDLENMPKLLNEVIKSKVISNKKTIIT